MRICVPVDLLNTIGSFLCDDDIEMKFRVSKRGRIQRINMCQKRDPYFGDSCRWVTSYAIYCKTYTSEHFEWLDDYFSWKF
jgi:hypothetical protein